MNTASFYLLHQIISLFMCFQVERPATASSPKQQTGAPNGLVCSTICLAVALCFFAGASLYDLDAAHGILVREVCQSVHQVIKAVNQSTSLELKIEFLESHDKQQEFARRFQEKSKARAVVAILAVVAAFTVIVVVVGHSQKKSIRQRSLALAVLA
jgi:UDP-N-acetylmuramoylalanine-D-glutamate ligase